MSTPPNSGVPVAPAPIVPSPPRGGCIRGALVGCGVAAILVLVLMAAFLVWVRRKPEGLTDFVMRQVEKNYAADVTPEEREKLRRAYAGFRQAVRDRRVGREPVDRMRWILGGVKVGPGPVTREQVRELTDLFEGIGTAGRFPAATPPPSWAPRPTP